MIDIDFFDSRFLPVETHALIHLKSKHDQYIVEGRLLEARGVERSIGIVYACFTSDYQDSKTDRSPL